MTNLSETHEHVLRNVLLELDHAITTVESLLREPAEHGALYQVQSGLPDGRREAVLARARALREDLAALVAELGLTPEVEDASRHIASLMSLLWTHLEDVRPRRLASYGQLPPGAETERLDSLLGNMIEGVLAVVRLVTRVTEYQPLRHG